MKEKEENGLMAKSEIVIQEYKSIRAEINNSFSSSKRILVIGLAIIAAVFSFGVLEQLNDLGSETFGPLQPSLAILSLCLAIPTVLLVMFTMCIGEYLRIQRAGTYMIDFEKRMNRYFGSNNELLLNWSNYLDDKNLNMEYNYKAVMFFLIAIHLLSHAACGIVINYGASFKWFVVQGGLFIFQGIGFGYMFVKYKSGLEKFDKIRSKIKKGEAKKAK